MMISVLFGVRKESYAGEYAPEVLAARDEFCVEENPENWQAEVERTKASLASEMQAMGLFNIAVDGDAIRARLLSTPTIKGTLESK